MTTSTMLLTFLKVLGLIVLLGILSIALLYRTEIRKPIKASSEAPYSYEKDLYKNRSLRAGIAQVIIPLVKKSEAFPDIETYRQDVLNSSGDNLKVPPENMVRFCHVTEIMINQVRVVRLVPKQTGNNRSILYMHGGSYLKGPFKEQWRMLNHIANSTGCTIYVPLYTLGLEAPFPKGLEDGMDVYRDLIIKYAPGELILMGDSAGGGMILAMAQQIRDEQLEAPGKLIAISPWLNLAGDHPEMMVYAQKDPMLQVGNLDYAAGLYADTAALDNPLVSPIHMTLDGIPPCLMMIGSHDLLYPDCEDFRRKAEAANYNLTYIDAPKMVHVWPAAIGYVPEARKGIKQIIDYILHYPIQTTL